VRVDARRARRTVATNGTARAVSCVLRVRVPPGGGASMDRPERSAIPRERLGSGSMSLLIMRVR
jgi:hypothetical protein